MNDIYAGGPVHSPLVEAGRLPKPGGGPSAEKRAASTFTALALARAADGSAAACGLSGGDPGYDETAKMVAGRNGTIRFNSSRASPFVTRLIISLQRSI